MTTVMLRHITASLESGSRPKGGVGTDGDVPSLGGEHLRDDGGFNLASPKRISHEYYSSLRRGRISAEDILIVKDGATTGRTCFVGHDFPFEKAAVNEHVFRLAIDTERAQPKYIFYYLRSPRGRAAIMSDFRGATVGGISRHFIDNLKVPLPPIEEQRRITAILDQADALRAKRRQALTLLDDLTQSIFIDLFGDPVSNEHEWERAPLGDLALRITDGEHQTPKRAASGYPLLSARNVQDGRLDLADVDYVGAEEYQRIIRRIQPEVGDILISCSGTIGRVARVTDATQFAMVRSVALVRPSPALQPTFVEHALRASSMRRMMVLRANSSAQANLFQNQIRALPMIVPPAETQSAFASRVESLTATAQELRRSMTTFDELFGALQARAFSGRL